MAPNLSKILYHWGLEAEVHSIAIKSQSIALSICTSSYLLPFEWLLTFLKDESGEFLGNHHWDEEVLKETRGEFVFAHVSMKFTYEFHCKRPHIFPLAFRSSETTI